MNGSRKMNWAGRWTLCATVVVLCGGSPALGQWVRVADFQDDYVATGQGGTRAAARADGWAYLWNATGPIGTAANYTPLVFDTPANPYQSVANGAFPDADPGAYVYMGQGVLHPGRGSGQGATWDRYAIAAFTVSAPGMHRISNSSISAVGGGTKRLQVIVNDNAPAANFLFTTGPASFNVDLGGLAPGDRIFVCVGPDTIDSGDGCTGFDFTVERNLNIHNANGASGVLTSSATLNGGFSGNTEAFWLWIYWGATDGGTVKSAWANRVALGQHTEGTYSTNVTGLTSDRNYFYRCYASNAAVQAWAPQSAAFMTGSLTVRATDALAKEAGLDPARFTLTRATSLTNANLTVYYRMGGVASNGLDYILLGGSATFAAGSSTAIVDVRPLQDANWSEGNESIVLTLQPYGFIPGGMNAATVTLQDAAAPRTLIWDNAFGNGRWDSTTRNWHALRGVPGTQPFTYGDHATFDGSTPGRVDLASNAIVAGSVVFTGTGQFITNTGPGSLTAGAISNNTVGVNDIGARLRGTGTQGYVGTGGVLRISNTAGGANANDASGRMTVAGRLEAFGSSAGSTSPGNLGIQLKHAGVLALYRRLGASRWNNAVTVEPGASASVYDFKAAGGQDWVNQTLGPLNLDGSTLTVYGANGGVRFEGGVWTNDVTLRVFDDVGAAFPQFAGFDARGSQRITAWSENYNAELHIQGHNQFTGTWHVAGTGEVLLNGGTGQQPLGSNSVVEYTSGRFGFRPSTGGGDFRFVTFNLRPATSYMIEDDAATATGQTDWLGAVNLMSLNGTLDFWASGQTPNSLHARQFNLNGENNVYFYPANPAVSRLTFLNVGELSPASALRKTGVGDLRLGGATYTGRTRVEAGTVVFGGVSNGTSRFETPSIEAVAGAVNVATGVTFTALQRAWIGGTATATLDSDLGPVSLGLAGGTLRWNRRQTYTDFAWTNGTLAIGYANADLSAIAVSPSSVLRLLAQQDATQGARRPADVRGRYDIARDIGPNYDGVTLASGANMRAFGTNAVYAGDLTLDGPVTFGGGGYILTLTGVVGGTGAVVNAADRLVLNGANVYAGGTRLTGGSVAANAAGALSSGPVSVGAATLEVAADGAARDNRITLTRGGYLRMAAQGAGNYPREVRVGAGAALGGDITGANYDAMFQNTWFEADAVLAHSAGPAPTYAQLVAMTGAGRGCVLYRGITATNEEASVGDDGTTGATNIYKGVAFGAGYPGGPFVGRVRDASAARTGIEMLMNGDLTFNASTRFDTANATRGVELVGPGTLVLAGAPQSLGTSGRFTRTGTPATQNAYVMNLIAANVVGPGQTWNVTDGRIALNTVANNLHAQGRVRVGRGATLMLGLDPSSGVFDLADGGAVWVNAETRLNNLNFGTSSSPSINVEPGATPLFISADRYLDNGGTPTLRRVITNSNVTVAGDPGGTDWRFLGSSQIILGPGRYLLGHRNYWWYLRNDSATIADAVDGSEIGFAGFGDWNTRLYVQGSINASGSQIAFGSASMLTTIRGNGDLTRVTEQPLGIVETYGALDADSATVYSGSMRRYSSAGRVPRWTVLSGASLYGCENGAIFDGESALVQTGAAIGNEPGVGNESAVFLNGTVTLEDGAVLQLWLDNANTYNDFVAAGREQRGTFVVKGTSKFWTDWAFNNGDWRQVSVDRVVMTNATLVTESRNRKEPRVNELVLTGRNVIDVNGMPGTVENTWTELHVLRGTDGAELHVVGDGMNDQYLELAGANATFPASTLNGMIHVDNMGRAVITGAGSISGSRTNRTAMTVHPGGDVIIWANGVINGGTIYVDAGATVRSQEAGNQSGILMGGTVQLEGVATNPATLRLHLDNANTGNDFVAGGREMRGIVVVQGTGRVLADWAVNNGDWRQLTVDRLVMDGGDTLIAEARNRKQLRFSEVVLTGVNTIHANGPPGTVEPRETVLHVFRGADGALLRVVGDRVNDQWVILGGANGTFPASTLSGTIRVETNGLLLVTGAGSLTGDGTRGLTAIADGGVVQVQSANALIGVTLTAMRGGRVAHSRNWLADWNNALNGATVLLLEGGKFVYDNVTEDRVVAGTFRPCRGVSFFDVYNSANGEAQTTQFSGIETAEDGATLQFQRNAGTGIQTAFFTTRTRVRHNLTLDVGPNSAVRIDNTAAYLTGSIAKSGNGPLTLAGTFGIGLDGSADLLTGTNCTLVTTRAGTLSKSYAFQTSSGLWRQDGLAGTVAANMVGKLGSLDVRSSRLALAAPAPAGFVTLTGMTVGRAYTVRLDLTNIATTVTNVVTELRRNPRWTRVRVLDADTVAVDFTATASQVHFVWDNGVDSPNDLGADVTAVAATEEAPKVTNSAGATDLTSSAATLNGELLSAGAGQTAVFVHWGPADGGTNAGAWANVFAWPAPRNPGVHSRNLTGLNSGRMYFYRFSATNSWGRAWADATAAFMTADVRVQATDGTATEGTSDSGEFTVYRPRTATNAALRVLYQLSGTASNGVDYVALSGSVAIPAGATSAVVRVTPLDDTILNEGNETVVLRLLAIGCALGSPSSATVTIADNDSMTAGLWTHRARIVFGTVPDGVVLTNFPALIQVGTNLQGFAYGQVASADARDLRFTDSAAREELAYQIDHWDTRGTSYVWVRVPRLSAGATAWMYWGNASAQMPAYATNGLAWSEGYLGVWHLGQTALGADDLRDSTANRFHGADDGETAAVNGQIGAARIFQKAGLSSLVLPGLLSRTVAPVAGRPLTLSCWFRTESVSTNPAAIERMMTLYDGSPGDLAAIGVGNRDRVRYFLNSASGSRTLQAGPVFEGMWYAAALSYNGDQVAAWFNGKAVTQSVGIVANAGVPYPVTFGCYATNGAAEESSHFDGSIDEVRISDRARSPAWLRSEWLTVASNSAFGRPSVAMDARKPYVESRDATAVMAQSATLNCELVWTGQAPATVTLYWGQTDGGTNATAWASSVVVGTGFGLGTVSRSVSGLATNRLYRFHWRAANAHGSTWAPGPSGTFRTRGQPAVENRAASEVTYRSARPAGQLTAGAFADAYVYFGTTDGGASKAAWQRSQAAGLRGEAEGEFATTVAGLLPDTVYWFRWYASNELGSAWASASTNFLTGWNDWRWDGGAGNVSWPMALNWRPDAVPTGVHGRAVLDNAYVATLPASITVGDTQRVGSVLFDSANTVNLDSPGTLLIGKRLDKRGSGLLRLDADISAPSIVVSAGNLHIGDQPADRLIAGTLLSDSTSGDSIRFEQGTIRLTNSITLNAGRLFVGNALVNDLASGALAARLTLNNAAQTYWEIPANANLDIDTAIAVNGAGDPRIVAVMYGGGNGPVLRLRNLWLGPDSILTIDEVNTVVSISPRLLGNAALSQRAASDDFDLINATSLAGPVTLTLGETNQQTFTAGLYGQIGTNVTAQIVNGDLNLFDGASIAFGGRIRHAFTNAANALRIYAGQTGVNGLSRGGTIELGGDRTLTAFVYRGTPGLVNRVGTTIEVPANQSAHLRANHGGAGGDESYVVFSNLLLRAGSVANLYGDNAMRPVVHVELRGNATINNDHENDRVFVGDLRDDGRLRRLRIAGDRHVRMIGPVSGTTILEGEMDNNATVLVLQGTPYAAAANTEFDLGGRTLNFHRGELHVWADSGVGTVNDTSAGATRIYHGLGGVNTMTNALVFNVNSNKMYVGYVNRSSPRFVNEIRARVVVAAGRTLTLQSNYYGAGGDESLVRWREVRLGADSALDLSTANNMHNEPHVALLGDASIRNNTGDDFRLFLGSVSAAVLGGPVLTATGANWLRLVGPIGDNATLRVGGPGIGRVSLQAGWGGAGSLVLDTGADADINASASIGTLDLRAGTLDFMAAHTLTVTREIKGAGTVGGAAGLVRVTTGTVRPGASAGALTIAGSLALGPDSRLEMELGGATDDRVVVNADLTLDGTVDVFDLGGATNQPYSIVEYAGRLTDNGLRVGRVPAGLTAWVDTSVPRRVRVVLVNAAAPAIQVGAATAIARTSATLNGTLMAGGAADVRVYWGETDAGTNAAAWAHVEDLSFRPEGAFGAAIGGLNPDTRYFYRCYAENSAGHAWSDYGSVFLTKPELDWTHRLKIRFSGYDRHETLTNFPALVILSTNIPGFRFEQFASQTGADLRFRDAGGSRLLNHEIEEWAPYTPQRPTQVPNCTLWLDAADPATLFTNTSGTVVSWMDKSGQGHHANNGQSTPRVVRARLNGKPAIAFDGADDALWTTYNFDTHTQYTIFAVARYSGTDNERIISSRTRNWLFGYHANADERFYAEGWVNNAGTANTNWHVHTGTVNNEPDPKAWFWKDTRLLTANNAGSGNGNHMPGQIALGGWGASEFSQCEVAEVIVFDRVLSSNERIGVELYLSDKYAFRFHSNAGSGSVWVQVPELVDTNSCIWAYWGSTETPVPLPDAATRATWAPDYRTVWHLNEPGVTVYDSTLSRHTGTRAYATTVAGAVSAAHRFDQNDAIDTGTVFPDLRQPFTVSTWVRPAATQGQYADVFGNHGGNFQGMVMQQNNFATNLFGFGCGNGSTWTGVGDVQLVAGAWQHVGVVCGRTNGVFARNGEARAQGPITGSHSPNYAYNFRLGQGYSGGGRYFNGAVDEFRIATVARSADWLWAEWASVASNGSFNAFGATEHLATPAVNNGTGATNVTLTQATLVGNLVSTGASATAVWVYWGATDGGTNRSAWASVAPFGSNVRPGALRTTVTLPVRNATYYYRFYARNAAGSSWALQSESFQAASVWVYATDAEADEANPADRAAFTFFRPAGATREAVSVPFTLAGSTATPDLDFTIRPSGSVTIPYGATSATVVVAARYDRDVEGPEEVRLRILPSTDYVTGIPSNATVVIVDNVATSALDLVWDNASGDGLWNTTSWNWHRPGWPFGSFTYKNGDRVVFDDTAMNRAVAVPGAVRPESVLLTNTLDYTLAVSGDIAGAARIVKEGTGLLTFSSTAPLTYSSGTYIRAGILRWYYGGGAYTRGIGTGPIHLDGGDWIAVGGAGHDSLTITNSIVVDARGGMIRADDEGNSGTLNLTGRFLGSGPLTLSSQAGGGDGGRMYLYADNRGFTGALRITGTAAAGSSKWVAFNGQNAVPGGASQVLRVDNGCVMFNATDTYANDIVLNGPARFLSGGVAILTGGVTGNVHNVEFAAGLLAFTPAAGKSIAGAGNVTLSAGTLHIPRTNDLFAGNLNITGGQLVLDGRGQAGGGTMSFAELTRARTIGPGPGQWQVSGAGGFAARGADDVVTLAGWDRDFTLGSAGMSGGGLYCNAGVKIATNVTLTGIRTWTALGRTVINADTTFGAAGPIHEIAGVVSDGGVARFLRLAGGGTAGSGSGFLRFSNPSNNLAASTLFLGGANWVPNSLSATFPNAIFTSDGAFGSAALVQVFGVVDGGNAGSGGILLLEDLSRGAPGTTFTRNLNYFLARNGGRLAGFGAYAGKVVYTGTLREVNGYAGQNQAMCMYAAGGATLQMGDGAAPATLANAMWSGTVADLITFRKTGPGDMVLENVAQTWVGNGNPADDPGVRWEIMEGRLTGRAADICRTGTKVGGFGIGTLFPAGTFSRAWNVKDTDAVTVNGVDSFNTSGAGNTAAIEVPSGKVFTQTYASGTRLQAAAAGAVLAKKGLGAWVYRAPGSPSNNGQAGMISVDEGVFDALGDTGNCSLRLAGGALLAGHASAFAGDPGPGNAANERAVSVMGRGGKIGISAGATSDVHRAATLTGWDQTGTNLLVLAARAGFSLIFDGGLGHSVEANSTLLVERDGTGSGAVRIDNGLTVNGTLGGTASLQLDAASNGTLTLNGTLSPGLAATGTLTVAGHVAFGAGAALAADIGAGGRDLLEASGDLSLGGTLVVRDVTPVSPGRYVLIRYRGRLSGSLYTAPVHGGRHASVDTNTAGEVAYVLDPLPASPLVVTYAAANILGTRASAQGELASTGAASTVVYVYWGTSDGQASAGAWQHAARIGTRNVGPVTYNLTPLTEGTTYHYRFFATNRFGVHWSERSATFRTPADPVVNNAGALARVGGASLRGQLAAENATVFVYWGETDGGTNRRAWRHEQFMGSLNEGASFAAEIGGLYFGQSYYYRCFATNVAGSDWSDASVLFFTQPARAGTPGLKYRTYDTFDGNNWVLPIENALEQTASGTGVQTAPIDYLTFAGTFAGITDNNNLTVVWHGVFLARESATYTFGTESDDGSALYIDLNNDGDFQEPGELLVNNLNYHGMAVQTGGAFVPAGQYRIAIGFFQGGGGLGMRAKWGIGAGLAWGQLNFIDASSGYFLQDWAVPDMAVANTSATNLTATAADLGGVLQGASAVFDVYAHWGAADGGNDPAAWTRRARVGVFTNAVRRPLAFRADGLAAGRTYYYTYSATNAATNLWAASSVRFTTPSDDFDHDGIPDALDADDDNDGIPDDYELLYPTVLNPLDSTDRNRDPDGDNRSNFEEWVSLTDPTDPASVLEFTGSSNRSGRVYFYFRASSGRTYGVDYRTDIRTGEWQTRTNGIAGTGGTIGIQADVGLSGAFYRITVTAP